MVRALRHMPAVRARSPESPGLKKFDVIVEAVLLAIGVPEIGVREYARKYRRRRHTTSMSPRGERRGARRTGEELSGGSDRLDELVLLHV